MTDSAPVYIVDDDQDDQQLVKDIFSELHLENQLFFFSTAKALLAHLKSSDAAPFLILCDVNIHSMDSFDLRQTLRSDKNLNYKSVPFIFWSTYATQNQIRKAYDLSVHGFFIKGKNFSDLKNSFKNIFAYWKDSKHPENN